MVITNEQREGMLKAAEPLIEWLNENCHPHCEVLVDQCRVRLTEDVVSGKVDKYLRD